MVNKKVKPRYYLANTAEITQLIGVREHEYIFDNTSTQVCNVNGIPHYTGCILGR